MAGVERVITKPLNLNLWPLTNPATWNAWGHGWGPTTCSSGRVLPEWASLSSGCGQGPCCWGWVWLATSRARGSLFVVRRLYTSSWARGVLLWQNNSICRRSRWYATKWGTLYEDDEVDTQTWTGSGIRTSWSILSLILYSLNTLLSSRQLTSPENSNTICKHIQ